jgi:hypothetical protein
MAMGKSGFVYHMFGLACNSSAVMFASFGDKKNDEEPMTFSEAGS